MKNSQFSVSQIVSKLEFSSTSFPGTIRKFLRYHPINEFEFFFESIGIDYGEVTNNGFSKPNVFFISEDPRVFDVACLLCGFGFPWKKLGILYRKHVSIFNMSHVLLHSRLDDLKACGFGTCAVVGICLTFPSLLSREDNLGGQLVDDLKRVFIDFNLDGFVDSNVDAWYEVCRKIRVFYELDIGKWGKAGELMGKCKSIFIDYPEDVLVEKVRFFCRLGILKADVGFLLLERPELLSIDLETPTISVLNILNHFGAPEELLKSAKQKYPYVVGRNKMAHLPHALRAMDLHDWFFNKIKHGHHHLLSNYSLSCADEDIDEKYVKGMDLIRCSRTHAHTLEKLNFLHSIGFAENSYSLKILANTHGTSIELQQRFDCLLAAGIEFSKLCKILSGSPKILNQDAQVLKQKVNFLCQEIGLSLEYLDDFPAYLCFNLEKRIKPRYKFHSWLEEQGLCTRKYTLGSIIATSEKNFIARLSLIHPTATKLWYEHFACKNDSKGRQQ